MYFTVLKLTGSAFEEFVWDEYMIVVEVDDRIFSMSVGIRGSGGACRGTRDGLILGSNTLTGTVPWEDAKVGAPKEHKSTKRYTWPVVGTLDTRHITQTQNQNKARRQFGGFRESDEEKGHGQPGRPESRADRVQCPACVFASARGWG